MSPDAGIDPTFSEVRPGIRALTQHTDQLTTTTYVYAPGSAWETHAHPEDQVTFIHSGGPIRFVVEGEDRLLHPGDLAVIPGGTPHSASVPADGEQAVSVNVWRRRVA